MSRDMRKRTFWHVSPVMIQIRLRIRAAWSESSLGSFSIAKDVNILHADNDLSDQTARMCRLIRVFIRRKCQKISFLMLRLKCYELLCSTV